MPRILKGEQETMKSKLVLLTVILLLIVTGAFAAVKQDAPDELRGIWVSRTDIYKGKAFISKMFSALAEANINTVCLPTYYKGVVTYPGSKYLPIDPVLEKIDPDYLNWMIKEAKKNGLSVEAWPEYGYYAYFTPDLSKETTWGVFLDKYPELTAITVDGVPYLSNKFGTYFSLCPSNPKSHELMTDLLTEMVAKYDFDALNVDRARYPSDQFCFCDYCKKHFKQETGLTLDKALLSDPGKKKVLIQWRKDRVTSFMERLRRSVDKTRPGVRITADVWSGVSDSDEKGQDWPTWLDRGYLDIAVPMMYYNNITQEMNNAISKAPSSRYMAAGITVETNKPETVRQHIQQARDVNAAGFVLWYMGTVEDDLPLLKSTVLSKPAKPFYPERRKLIPTVIKGRPKFLKEPGKGYKSTAKGVKPPLTTIIKSDVDTEAPIKK